MRKRVLFVSCSAGWTGPTNSLLLILCYVRKRFEVAVLLPGHGDFTQALEDEGIPCFTLPRLNKGAVPAVNRMIWRERFGAGARVATGDDRNGEMAAHARTNPQLSFVSNPEELVGTDFFIEVGPPQGHTSAFARC